MPFARIPLPPARYGSPALVGLLLATAACSAPDEAPADARPVADTVDVVVTPGDGATEVRPDLPVTVEAEGGTIVEVVVERTDAPAEQAQEVDAVTGSLNEDATRWTSDWTLPPGGEFTVTAVVADGSGGTGETVSAFSTLEAAEGRRLELKSNTPNSGDEVGVGMPVIVNFDFPVRDRERVEAAMVVRSEKPAEGAWNWFGDKTMVFRPREYWEPNQEVTVDMHLAGVLAGEGVYGVENHRLTFRVGRSQISEVDNDTHRMVVTRDGEQIRDFPISNGDGSAPQFWTTSGVHLTMTREQDVVMDSSTVNMPPGAGSYRVVSEYAVRISDSGEYAHSSPNPLLGQANTSHGCVNMSLGDSRWFYENTLLGDPFVITGTPRELEVTNGWGYWQRPWGEWLAQSTTGAADRTDDDASPGSPHSGI